MTRGQFNQDALVDSYDTVTTQDTAQPHNTAPIYERSRIQTSQRFTASDLWKEHEIRAAKIHWSCAQHRHNRKNTSRQLESTCAKGD